MAVYLLLLLALCCWGLKFSSFHEDYLSIPATTAIKGVFTFLILLSHLRQYITLGPGLSDRAFGFTLRYLDQLIVVPFLFYSGFGIVESARNKEGYGKGFFKKRFLKTLLHFDLAVLLFLILQTILGTQFETRDYVWCWIGWTSLGNSNWFIFDILALYLIAGVALILKERFKWSEYFIGGAVTLGLLVLWLLLYHFKVPEHWWYDTLAAFPAGIWFSMIRHGQPKSPNPSRWYFIVAFFVGLLLWRQFVGIDIYGCCSILFAWAIVAASSFVKVDNKALQWLGKHCFSLYILQRLPMILFSRTQLVEKPILFSAAVIVAAIPLAALFTAVTDQIDKRIFA